jgi:hypothetical protein
LYHKTDKTSKTINSYRIGCGGAQPLAAGKQPVGVLPPTKKSFVGFAGFVGKKTQLCWNCPK